MDDVTGLFCVRGMIAYLGELFAYRRQIGGGA